MLPDPVLPGLSVRAGARGRRHRIRAARSGERLAARLLAGARQERRGRLPQLPVEPGCRRRAGRRVRGRGRVRARDRRCDRARLRLRRPRLRRARAEELPRHAGRQGGRRRDVLDVQVLRHGRLAGRVRRRQRGDRRADQPARRPLPRRDFSADPGGLHRRAHRAAGLGRGAARHLPAPPRPRARGARAVPRADHCEGPSTSGSSSPRASPPRRLLTEHRVVLAPGEGFGPSGAGYARLCLAVSDETLETGSSVSPPRSAQRARPARLRARRPSPHRGRRTRPSGLPAGSSARVARRVSPPPLPRFPCCPRG